MGLTRAAQYPDYSSPDIAYIPELFAPQAVERFYDVAVVPDITNKKYEGIIKKGTEKVIVRQIPDITISDDAVGEEFEGETPSAEPIELELTLRKRYCFKIDDTDEALSDMVLSKEFIDNAGQRMAAAVDTAVLASIVADAHSTNIGDHAGAVSGGTSGGYNLGKAGSPVEIDTDTVLAVLTGAMVCAEENNWPEEDRWIVLPASFIQKILMSDIKNVSITGDSATPLRNGRVTDKPLAGFHIYKSNLLPTVTDGANKVFKCPFGHGTAITFAAAMIKNDVVAQLEKTWGKKFRGLYVAGWKTMIPRNLGLIYGYLG